jgi:hypothetical protein
MNPQQEFLSAKQLEQRLKIKNVVIGKFGIFYDKEVKP